MKERKILIIGDHKNMFSANVPLLRGRGYDVAEMNFAETREVPTEKYDAVVVGSLNGCGLAVLSAVNANRKILYSQNFPSRYNRIIELVGIEIHSRSEPITKFLGGIK